MKKSFVTSAVIGGALGAMIVMILLVILNRVAPMETKDILSFVLSTISIVIASLTVLGAVVLVTTWNDIDERTGKIVTKYEERAKASIDLYGREKEAELDQNAKERQATIDATGQRAITFLEELRQKEQKRVVLNASVLAVLGVAVMVSLYLMRLITNKQEKRIEQLERRHKL